MKSFWKTPLLLGGVFLCLPVFVFGSSSDLAEELFNDGDWPAAQREAQRAATGSTSISERERLRWMAAVAALRAPNDRATREAALADLQALNESAAAPESRGRAALEVGHSLLRQGRPDEAWPWLARAFRSGASDPVVLAAGAELLWLGRVKPSRWNRDSDLRLPLATLRPVLWNLPLVSRERRHPSLGVRAGLWLTRFYRSQIRPAIGSRCQMHPTCSAYFVEAAHRHGWRSLPLIADRLIREPSVVQAGENPIYEPERIAYPDSVEAHTFWWSGVR